jgi:hypothetical protein
MKVPSASRDAMSDEPRRSSRGGSLPGLTLLELTVVIVMMLLLITVLFIGARAWKRGSDRAGCIMSIQSVQKGVRGYANLYGFNPGANAPNLQTQLIGIGRFVESMPICPGSGTYTFGQTFGANTIPPMGNLYMECSLASTQQHVPDVKSDW